MSDGDSLVSVLGDAKSEYTKHLRDVLRPALSQGIQSLYEDSKEMCDQDNTPSDVLKEFQNNLKRIPKWSQDIIEKEFKRIEVSSKCDHIDDLIKAVFITHTKIRSIIQKGKKGKKIDLKVPKATHFIHLCYIECARQFWESPYLFCDQCSKYEYRNNIRQAESIIGDVVDQTIRDLLPVRQILKEYLGCEYESDVEDDVVEADVKLAITTKQKNNIFKMVKKELEGMNGNIDVNNEGDIRKLIEEELQKVVDANSGKKPKGDLQTADDLVEELIDRTIASITPPPVKEPEVEVPPVKEPVVEVPKDEVSKVEVSKDEVPKDEVPKDEVSKDEVSKDDNPVEEPEPEQAQALEPEQEQDNEAIDDIKKIRLGSETPPVESDDELDELSNYIEDVGDGESSTGDFKVKSLDELDFESDFDTDDELESVDFNKVKNEVNQNSDFSFF